MKYAIGQRLILRDVSEVEVLGPWQGKTTAIAFRYLPDGAVDWAHESQFTPIPRSHEDIAWEAVCDYFADTFDYSPIEAEPVAAELHALILAAIEEACDG